MKYRLGACAATLLLAACQNGGVDSDIKGAASAQHAASLPALAMAGPAARVSIASAPDHGALMEYGNGGKPMKREGAHTWYPVQVSEEHAIRAIVDGEMTIPYPDGTQAKLRYERHVEGADGNWSWIGRVEGGNPGQEAIFTFGEKAVFASIPQPNGEKPLQIQTSNGGLWAVTSDPDKLVIPDIDGDTKVRTSEVATSTTDELQAEAKRVTASAVTAAAKQSAGNTIDVAVGYTSGFRSGYGSQSAAVTRLNFLMEIGNETYRNSKINGYLRLVHAVELNYTDASSNESALEQLTGSSGSGSVTVPASLKPLRTARDNYGADIAILVRKFSNPENEGCGIAWLNGADGEEINPATDDDYGYAVVSDGTDSGTDGKTYYCPEETLVHEAAHLAGSAHEKANATVQGRYAYSYGYASASDRFHTVMAYGEANQTLYRTFSNPQITFCGGAACGIANQADNARSLNQTISVVSAFRATKQPFTSSAVQDFNGDGRSDLFWRHLTQGRNAIWLGADANNQRAVTNVAATAWAVSATGDFNADGKSDVVWRNRSDGRNTVWLSADSANEVAMTRVTKQSWKIVGAGDFDGDGKSDVVWRDEASGRNAIWLAAKSATQKPITAVTKSSWKIVGVGDFDGDGVSDLLWREDGTGRNAIWLAGDAGNQKSINDRKPASWKVAGVGDFNGDGVSDIFWRDAGSGSNSIWLSGDSLNTVIVPTQNLALTVADIADFDGDGTSDVLWRNSSGANSIWYSGSIDRSNAIARVASSSWQVVP